MVTPGLASMLTTSTLQQEVHGVNMGGVTPSSPAPPTPYHHGDLRNALVAAALDLAREGGPDAIVLREAARRVGVSPTAAYRHFAALPQLVEAVTVASLGALARAMEAELDRVDSAEQTGHEQTGDEQSGDEQQRALQRMHAIGRGYVHFALAEPGLFATAFAHKEDVGHVEGETGASGRNAEELLEWALDGLVEAGSLAAEDRAVAAPHAWAVVHGLSMLLLGPRHDMAVDEREALIESSLDLVGRGLLIRP
jgi:AcrR family transcriptional regulator